MPNRMRAYFLAAAVLALLHAPSALASSVRDSLRYMLEADASPTDRAGAFLRLSARRSSADPGGALSCTDEALRLARLAGDSALAHEALLAQGALHLRMGHRAEHMEAALRALRIAKHLGRPELISLDLQGIARAYRLRDEPERALREARDALAIAIKAGAEEARKGAELLLLDILIEAGEFALAQREADRALSGTVDEHHAARVQLLLAFGLLKQSRPFDAQPLLMSALRAFEARGDVALVVRAELGLARCAILQGHHSEARDRLQRIGSGAAAGLQAITRLELLEAEHDLALAVGDHRKAHGLLRLLSAQRDSMARADRALLLSGMHVMHDSERWAQDNAELRSENARQLALIAGSTRAKQLLIGASAALAALAAALVALLLRYRRTIRRSRLKSQVIGRQRDELQAKGMELERQNLRLREALLSDEQKDLVLREIHHRVKNNLQAIDALLSLSMASCEDHHARKALREARGRLTAMAMVHSAIHRNGSEQALPVHAHFAELARQVLVAHGLHDAVSAVVTADEAFMDAETLLPLSLLVNELLTNSVKHAFANGRTGRISLSLRLADGGWQLRYSDEGSAPLGQCAEEGVGLGLIRSLADQLNGTLQPGHGELVLSFPAPGAGLRKAS